AAMGGMRILHENGAYRRRHRDGRRISAIDRSVVAVGGRQQLAVLKARSAGVAGRCARPPGQTAGFGAGAMERPQHRTIISGFGGVEATVGFTCGPCQCSGRYSDQLRNLLAAMPGAAVSVLEDVFERAYVFEQKLADLYAIVLLCVPV